MAKVGDSTEVQDESLADVCPTLLSHLTSQSNEEIDVKLKFNGVTAQTTPVGDAQMKMVAKKPQSGETDVKKRIGMIVVRDIHRLTDPESTEEVETDISQEGSKTRSANTGYHKHYWSPEETLTLLEALKPHLRFHADLSKPVVYLNQGLDAASELLAQRGHQVSRIVIMQKWSNMFKTYKTILRREICGSEIHSTWSYFDEVHRMVASSPAVSRRSAGSPAGRTAGEAAVDPRQLVFVSHDVSHPAEDDETEPGSEDTAPRRSQRRVVPPHTDDRWLSIADTKSFVDDDVFRPGKRPAARGSVSPGPPARRHRASSDPDYDPEEEKAAASSAWARKRPPPADGADGVGRVGGRSSPDTLCVLAGLELESGRPEPSDAGSPPPSPSPSPSPPPPPARQQPRGRSDGRPHCRSDGQLPPSWFCRWVEDERRDRRRLEAERRRAWEEEKLRRLEAMHKEKTELLRELIRAVKRPSQS